MDHAGQFEIATEWTGKPHIFSVLVHGSRDSMLHRLEQVAPETDWRETNAAGETPSGAFLNAHGFMSNDSPTHLGDIHLSRDHLDINTLTHEVTHAAMFAYECDMLGNHSRARAHMTMTNETIAYMIGDLMEQLAERLLGGGYYDEAPNA